MYELIKFLLDPFPQVPRSSTFAKDNKAKEVAKTILGLNLVSKAVNVHILSVNLLADKHKFSLLESGCSVNKKRGKTCFLFLVNVTSRTYTAPIARIHRFGSGKVDNELLRFFYNAV